MPTCYLYVGLVGKHNRDRRARPKAQERVCTPACTWVVTWNPVSV